MQSRKASNSKKTSKNINEAIVDEKSTLAAEAPAKPRASRSSKSKKEVSAETLSGPSAKNHRKAALGAANIPASESSLVAKTLPEVTEAPKAMAAAAGVGSTFSEAPVIDPVGVVTAPESGVGPQYSREEVAKLAYSYWISRGYSHGYAEEDWLRAEAELTGKR
jgi:hypothetical protein